MKILVILYCVVTLLILRINGVQGSKWKLPREEVAEIEKQIQLQRNYTVKTIRTRYGDLYDCVTFYKQPAFNHPLSKNNIFIPQNRQTLSQGKSRKKASLITRQKLGLKGGGCPDGTVPIKRVTKEYFIRAKLAQASYVKPAGTRYARCSEQQCEGQGCHAFSGVSATLTVYNPEVIGDQYSAAVMKLQMGADSIETGWRVDPKLNGDNKTHLYIHTDARDIHCFNTLCEGFVATNKNIPVDSVFGKVSTVGGPRYGIDLTISMDNKNGNWILRVAGNIEIGYWPSYLFQSPGLSEYVEWGGEVFSPEGTPKPGMGSGEQVIEDTTNDAYYCNVKVQNGNPSGVDDFVDPINLICKAQTGLYEAKNEGNVGPGLEYLIYWGGIPSTTGGK